MNLGLLKNKETQSIIFLVILALLVRIPFLLMHQIVESDGAEFLTIGKNLVSGKGYLGLNGKPDLVFPPLYPLVSGLMWLVIGELELSGRLVSLIFGALLVVPIFYFAKKLYGEK